jgi:3-mercaptopyruvate sulfurtransferase SseA
MAEHTSARAAFTLMKLGVKNVLVLKGGYGDWVTSGSPVVAGDKPN